MATKDKAVKIRTCPECKTTAGETGGKTCPVCGAGLLTMCPACRVIIEDNGDAKECKACGLKFVE